MTLFSLCALVAAAAVAELPGTTFARQIPQNQKEPRVVGLDTQRIPVVNPARRDGLRRRGVVQEGLDNEVWQ